MVNVGSIFNRNILNIRDLLLVSNKCAVETSTIPNPDGFRDTDKHCPSLLRHRHHCALLKLMHHTPQQIPPP